VFSTAVLARSDQQETTEELNAAKAAIELLQKEMRTARSVARQSLGGGGNRGGHRGKSRLSIDVVFSPGGKLPRQVRHSEGEHSGRPNAFRGALLRPH
jgi:hypothetical protein